jgi:transposase-like protein
MLQLDLFSYQKLQAPECKRCSSNKIKKDGRYRRVSKQTHRYKCNRCGCRFVLVKSDLEKMRYSSSVISFAVDLYTNTGIALRTLKRKLAEYFSVKVSHETIRNWIKKTSKHIHLPRVSDLKTRFWCVDEHYLKVNGMNVFLWVILDPENKVVLAWHVSRLRTLKDAVHVLKTAFQKTDNTPWQIITDHLPLYQRAIRKVFFRKQCPEHYQDTLQRNNYIERLFREVKRRTKWFSSFRAYSSITDFFNVFFYCYNHNKKHKTINRTPLEYKTVHEALTRAPQT